MKFDITDELGEEADAVCEKIRPLLAGHGPIVQSLILANLTSAWIAGHLAHSDGEIDAPKTRRLREDILMHFIELIRQLIPMHHARIMEEQKERFHDRTPNPG
jgi:hypothetical protein